jgi:hypothetical protein
LDICFKPLKNRPDGKGILYNRNSSSGWRQKPFCENIPPKGRLGGQLKMLKEVLQDRMRL